MASQAIGKQPADRPTTYYFAYGSNLHLTQMKRRCPNSRYIGRARLVNYRWQINERGYANVIAAEGHWVDGLVYEINPVDEAKLDINEGVSKNAYIKRHMNVQLHRAPSTLYRRPTSWIVKNGGPAKIARQAREEGHKVRNEDAQHWVQEVLVYISLNHVRDSDPKEEYVNRINMGLVDAKALGMEDDYISNCIRPYIPPTPNKEKTKGTASGADKLKPPSRGQKRNTSPRTGERSPGERSPARKGQSPSRPDKQTPQRAPANRASNNAVNAGNKRRANLSVPSPTLPPRPRSRDAEVIVVEEHTASYRPR